MDSPLTVVLKMLKHSSLHGNFFLLLREITPQQLKVLGSLKWEDTILNIAVCLKYIPHLQIFAMQYKLSKCYCHSDICVLCFIFSCLCVLPRKCENLAPCCLMSCFLCGGSLIFCSK